MRLDPLLVMTASVVLSASAGIMIVSCADTEGGWSADAAAPPAVTETTIPRVDPPAPPPVGPEATRAGPPEPPDPKALAVHAENEIEALCVLTRGCCQAAGQTKFDMTKCRATYKGYGFQGDLLGVSDGVVRGGRVTVDKARGSQCYSAIRALGCNNISAAAYASATNACFTTLRGTLQSEAECRATVECQSGLHCAPSVVGELAGRCVPIKAIGASCEEDGECGYRLNGNACDPVAEKCVGQLPRGAACRLSGQCASQVCAGTCVAKLESLILPGECATFE